HASEVNRILEQQYKSLAELDWATWEPARRLLGIDCRFVLASELPVSGKGPQLLLNICRHLEADTYLSGAFGQDYIDADEFAVAGVEVKYFEYDYPNYSQRFNDFLPYLSYLDMLFNVGLDRDQVLAGGKLQIPQTIS
ncbi:MAG: WbqC family protein, partial [Anaerolineaceae bacterium]